jgi:NAD(P)-dependent dehydrogenase (short-subunit alcohol dehydrogenase family)
LRDFDGIVAYVTGGSSGIGLAVASELARRGAHVALLARDQARLDAAVRAVLSARGSDGQRVASASCDVADAAAVEAAIERLAGDLGAPDLVVNCAGFAYLDYFENVGAQRFRAMADANLFGTYNVCQSVLRRMKGGTLVNVASVAGLVGFFGAAAYCATKFGVVGLSEALRNELRPRGIRVAVLCPPDTDTPGLERENLTKPPETHAVEGTAGTYSPAQVALALLRGLRRGRFLIFCGFMSRLTGFVHRIAPRLVYAVMDADVARARKNQLAKENLR